MRTLRETSRLPPAGSGTMGVQLAIKLLGHVWGNAATASGAERRPGNEWFVAVREPSRWNPSAVRAAATPKPGKATAAEPVWAETQPWCHD